MGHTPCFTHQKTCLMNTTGQTQTNRTGSLTSWDINSEMDQRFQAKGILPQRAQNPYTLNIHTSAVQRTHVLGPVYKIRSETSPPSTRKQLGPQILWHTPSKRSETSHLVHTLANRSRPPTIRHTLTNKCGVHPGYAPISRDITTWDIVFLPSFLEKKAILIPFLEGADLLSPQGSGLAAVTNHHHFIVIKQHKFIILHFCRSEDWQGVLQG